MSNGADNIAARLERVSNDVDAVEACRSWIADSLREGASGEGVLAKLVGNGGGAERAQSLVEEVRRKPRESRGVLGTRARIANPDPNGTTAIRGGNVAAAAVANLIFA